MKMFQRLGTLVACVLLSGCLSSSSSPAPMVSEPPPSAPGVNDVMRVGDKVTVRLTGVPDEGYILEKEISASGDITVPTISPSPFMPSDAPPPMSPQKSPPPIGTDKSTPTPMSPSYRRIALSASEATCAAPTACIYAPDLTLLGAINSCGGFTEYANRKAVRVTRGKDVFQVDCVAAQKGGADPAVFPGDEIYVPRTIL
jgi:protein involved in polysaccharide export with SLBB domain